MRPSLLIASLAAGATARPYTPGYCWQQSAIPKLLADFQPLEQPSDGDGVPLPAPRPGDSQEWRDYLLRLRKGERKMEAKSGTKRRGKGVTVGDDCRRLRLSGHERLGGLTLEGICRDRETNDEWDTSINLNQCLGNFDGRLGWIRDGHFDKYCWNCNVGISPPAPGAMLKCDCNNDDGTTFYAWVEIGDHVEHPLALKPDGKGRLTCGNVVGTREILPDDDNFKRSLGEEESSWVEAGDVDGAEPADEYVDWDEHISPLPLGLGGH